jgi:hypothetical protein
VQSFYLNEPQDVNSHGTALATAGVISFVTTYASRLP